MSVVQLWCSTRGGDKKRCTRSRTCHIRMSSPRWSFCPMTRMRNTTTSSRMWLWWQQKEKLPGFNWSDKSDVIDHKQRARRPNKRRGFEVAYSHFQRFYFCRFPVYDERDFLRRFWMTRRIFERINNKMRGKSAFIHQRDAAVKMTVHPEIRIIAALRIFFHMGFPFKALMNIVNLAQPLLENHSWRLSNRETSRFRRSIWAVPTKRSWTDSTYQLRLWVFRMLRQLGLSTLALEKLPIRQCWSIQRERENPL